MKRKLLMLLAALMPFAWLVGCSNDSPLQEETTPEVCPVAPETSESQKITDLNFTPSEKYAAHQMADFSSDFLREMANARPAGENVVASPLSAQILLSLLANASDDQARKEIVEALGCTDIAVANSLSCKFLTDMPRSHVDVKMALANSVWYNDKYAISPMFEDVLNTFYNSTSYPRDFSNSPALVTEINKWCADQTNNLIDKIVDQINPSDLTIMANAIYFKAPWAHPFAENDTKTELFKGLNGNSQVEMMHLKESLLYKKGENWTAVNLPYTQATFNAWLVLPDEGTSVNDLLQSIKLSDLNSEQASTAFIDLSMPRFDIKTDAIKLNEPLKALGVKTIFEKGICTMFTTPVSSGQVDVSQKSTINFSEKGAEASSVTWVDWATSTGDDAKPQNITFTLNRPFLFYITEYNTGSCLIAGKIANL